MLPSPNGLPSWLVSALAPTAVLLLPLVLLYSAPVPIAVLPLPVRLLKSAEYPLTVLLPPLRFREKALFPITVFALPVIVRLPAPPPMKVLTEPKSWMKSAPSFRTFPAVADDLCRSRLPSTRQSPPPPQACAITGVGERMKAVQASIANRRINFQRRVCILLRMFSLTP